MKNFTVYFELYGKKMKATVLAESKINAQQIVKDKIIFHKTVEKPGDEFNKSMDIFNDLFEMFDGVKK